MSSLPVPGADEEEQPNIAAVDTEPSLQQSGSIIVSEAPAEIPIESKDGDTSDNSDQNLITTLQIDGQSSTDVDQKVESNLTKEQDSNKEPDKKLNLFVEDKGPHWYKVVNNIVTPRVVTENLSKVYEELPIFGKPECQADLDLFYEEKIREFVGCDLDDIEYSELKNYCSSDHLKTGREISFPNAIPKTAGRDMLSLSKPLDEDSEEQNTPNLFVLRNYKLRCKRDKGNCYKKKFKYKGVRIMSIANQVKEKIPNVEVVPPDLEPGKDVLYKVRVYRPFMAQRVPEGRKTRQTVFNCELVVCGRQPLCALRDRIVCRNDFDVRLDMSHNPDAHAHASAKEVFPSGFLFLNNIFYVDERAGCRDTSAVIRAWAARRGRPPHAVRPLTTLLADVPVRLAHPEVYIHQGNCEHVFLFSEVRLLNFADPLLLRAYPLLGGVSYHHSVYCTTCAEYSAKWLVTGTARVPFDPAFFCDMCFRQYMYKDGKKIGDFNAYYYRGNEINMLKPSLGQSSDV